MTRGIAAALASAAGFVIGFITPAVLFMVVNSARRAPSTNEHGSAAEEFMLLFYYIGVYALAGAVAYAAITAASRNWRERAPREVAVISGLVGAAAQILHWTGLSLILLVPLTHVLPHKAAILAGIAMPGVLVGVAVLIWSATRKAKVPAVAGNADGKA